MARSLALSNGELYVGLDSNGLVDTIHYPFIGHRSHTSGSTHKIGVWVDGQISWVDESGWSHKSNYPTGALAGHTVLVNEAIGVVIELEDIVDADTNLLVRNIHVVNIHKHQRHIRLFCHQSFNIGGFGGQDTAQYLPSDNSLVHYRGRCAFLISGAVDAGQVFDQYTVGRFGQGMDGTWRDAEDGHLSMCASECGQTDSTIGFSLTIGGLSSRRVHYWIVAAESVAEARKINNVVRKQGVYKRMASTLDAWRKLMSPSYKVSEQLSPTYRKTFLDSLMIIKSQIDNQGAIISDVPSDRPGMCDPGAGSAIIWPMIRLGFRNEALRYFDFMRQSLTEGGYLLAEYRADGAVGPTNLPYDGEFAPLDSSQTAITLFVFCQMYGLNRQQKLLQEYYSKLVMPMANFLADYTDDQGLPLPSYVNRNSDKKDLTSYATAITYAALTAAIELADYTKDQKSSVKWRTAAEQMRLMASSVFLDKSTISRAIFDKSTDIASLYGSFMFGLVDIDHPVLSDTAKHLERTQMNADGLFYHDQGPDYLGSLWMAQYYMEVGQQSKADKIIDKISIAIGNRNAKNTNFSSALYAEYVSTLLDMITRK